MSRLSKKTNMNASSLPDVWPQTCPPSTINHRSQLWYGCSACQQPCNTNTLHVITWSIITSGSKTPQKKTALFLDRRYGATIRAGTRFHCRMKDYVVVFPPLTLFILIKTVMRRHCIAKSHVLQCRENIFTCFLYSIINFCHHLLFCHWLFQIHSDFMHYTQFFLLPV